MICSSTTTSAIESFHTAREGGGSEDRQQESGSVWKQKCQTEEVTSRVSTRQPSSRLSKASILQVPQHLNTQAKPAQRYPGELAAQRPCRPPICVLRARTAALSRHPKELLHERKRSCSRAHTSQPTETAAAAMSVPHAELSQPDEQPAKALSAVAVSKQATSSSLSAAESPARGSTPCRLQGESAAAAEHLESAASGEADNTLQRAQKGCNRQLDAGERSPTCKAEVRRHIPVVDGSLAELTAYQSQEP